MIYLILDTNIWLYLANGLDPIAQKDYESLHFDLLNSLKELKGNGDICVLINDVIIKEWEKNKKHSRNKVEKLKAKLDSSNNIFVEIRKYVKSDTENLEQEYIEGIREEIIKNEEHIENVERFLLNDCEIVDVSEEIKVQVFDRALSNRAPFHNKKNNMADATILFSAADYLKDELLSEDKSAIFVSNNIDDFTDGRNRSEFHPQIQEDLNEVPIKFERVLPGALRLSKQIILQIEEYYKIEEWLESVSFYCRTPNCEGNKNFSPWGYLNRQIKIIYEGEEMIDPNQLNIDGTISEPKELEIVGLGDCIVCGTLHIECPACGCLIYIEDEIKQFTCSECMTRFEIKHDKKQKEMCLFVQQNNEVEN